MNRKKLRLSRRQFVTTAAATVSAIAVHENFGKFALALKRNQVEITFPWGPLRPTLDDYTGLPLIQLPEGFSYRTFGWTREPLSNGKPTPGAHDGMAVIRTEGSIVTLCRNHELSTDGPSFAHESLTYDVNAGGGCTFVKFDCESGEFVSAEPAIGGTIRNCAGGATPWGSWLTCEETVLQPGDVDNKRKVKYERKHGYVFEVKTDGVTSARPIVDMGRFVHEAVAVDPASGFVYLTEDKDQAGLYRFIPKVKGQLEQGGQLQMMKLKQSDDVRKDVSVSTIFDVSWVDIEDPDRAHSKGKEDSAGVFLQGKQQGAATFARLEGICHQNGNIYITATSGGNASKGQVWAYRPQDEQVKLLFESPGQHVLDMPDNMTIGPRGGILLCEDGNYTPQRMQILTQDGKLAPFAVNNVQLNREFLALRRDYRGEEWCGATFSEDGKWLFANIQTPGFTIAITGPWQDGPL